MLFFWSWLCGMAVGAPVGVAGALVADSALAHNGRRMILTVIAAALGDTVLAYVVGLFSETADQFIHANLSLFRLGGGFLFILLGLYLFYNAWKDKSAALPDPEKTTGFKHYVLAHFGPAGAAFFVALFHPGSMLFMLAVTGWVLSKCGPENFSPEEFALGIGGGSVMIFAFSAFFFWKIRQKAGKFVSLIRYALAVIVALFGISLLFTFIYHINQDQEKHDATSSSLS